MKNPIQEARKQLNLNIKEFALIAGVTEQTVRWNEKGDNVEITPKILNFLKENGFDKEKLEKDYQSFRDFKKNELLKSLKKKIRA